MTLILAKFLGLYLLFVGAAFLYNPSRARDVYSQVFKNEGFLFLGGIMALIFGALIVSVHNVWVLGWPVLITILGWWGLIKGFGLIAVPEFVHAFDSMGKKPDLFYRTIGGIAALVGLFFSYHGWS